MNVFQELGRALAMAGVMGWEILWPLILGFALSGVIQALVSREWTAALMSDDSPGSLAAATGLGAASSSCSYAAVSLARSLFRKVAHFTAAMASEIASTNLVIELGIILTVMVGWQFTLAEFIGGPIMIIGVALGFRWWMRDASSRQPVSRPTKASPDPWKATQPWTCPSTAREASGNGCAPWTG